MATDVQDVLSLWCHGVSTSNSKGKCGKDFSSESDSDSDDSLKYKKRCKKKKRKKSAFEEKTNQVEEFVTKLRQKHGSRYKYHISLDKRSDIPCCLVPKIPVNWADADTYHFSNIFSWHVVESMHPNNVPSQIV